MFPVKDLPLNAADMGADVTSRPIYVGNFSDWSVHFKWTGAPVGNVFLEATNFPPGDDIWEPISDTEQATGGVDGSHMIERLGGSGIEHIRLRFSRTSGTGALTARFFGQGR